MIKIKRLRKLQFLFLPAINQLLRELQKDLKPLRVEDLIKILSNQNLYLFVAFRKERPVGMATIFFTQKCSGFVAEVHDVVVDRQCRGQGIGDMLIEKLLEAARLVANQKRKSVTLTLTSRQARKAANNLYRKYGFGLVARACGASGTNLYKLVVEAANKQE